MHERGIVIEAIPKTSLAYGRVTRRFEATCKLNSVDLRKFTELPHVISSVD